MSIEKMRDAGKLASQTLDYITDFINPGITTLELNDLCHEFIIKNNAIPAPLNYKGFPKSICTSVNHVVCHGIPSSDKKLNDGDILNIDVTVILDGWHGDTSRMFTVGKTPIKAKRLIDVTYDAMMKGIEIVRPGIKTGDIGHAIQKYVESNGMSVVRDFCGHGIGQKFHTLPQIVHFGDPNTGETIEEGMFITIEPMVNLGKADTKVLSDGWTAVTRDKSLSAQWEHTLAVTTTGFEILTVSV